MLLFGFLVSWSNHVAPLPIRGLSALEVFPRVLGVGIGLEVLWHSLLFVGFGDLMTLGGSVPIYFFRCLADGGRYMVWCLYVPYVF